MRCVRFALVIELLVCVAVMPAVAQTPLPTAPPESVGFIPERLALLEARMQQFVDSGKHAGVGVLIARDGKIVLWRAWGMRDREQRLPMEKDTIVRIYSMSKLITTIAVMQLVEQARIRLDDPVEKYLPEFAKRRVWVGGTARAPRTVPAKRPFTIKDLLTHTSGYRYGNMYSHGELDDLYESAKILDATSLDDAVARMAKMPLAFQPGERFAYGVGLDILGAVVQRVAGQPFAEYVDAHVCRPLGMRDTSYGVPAEKRHRLATVYVVGKTGALEPEPKPMMSPIDGVPAWGGAGMFSTLGDYARLGQALLNGGELDGARILGRKTVELMRANHLNHLARQTHQFSESNGFGLGGGVRIDLAKGNELGSVGQFGWGGAATTDFNMDPAERTVFVLVSQHFPLDEEELIYQARTLFYAALR